MTLRSNTLSKSGLGVLAVGAALALSPLKADALAVSSAGVTGGCATTPYTNFVGTIDVLSGGSWSAEFSNGDPERGCFFDLENNSSSDAAVTIAVATVNQSGQSYGFRNGQYHVGGVEFKTVDSADNPVSLWSVAEGNFGSNSFNFNIAANDSVAFDVLWGEAYATGDTQPKINFGVSATPIPLPAAAWLLLGVSGALVAAKRRSARRDA